MPLRRRLLQLRANTARPVSTVLALALSTVLLSSAAQASAIYTYDQLGRVTTAHYDNGTCVAYAYDANGNRTSQTNVASGAPGTPTWGTGTWGCFNWTPQ